MRLRSSTGRVLDTSKYKVNAPFVDVLSTPHAESPMDNGNIPVAWSLERFALAMQDTQLPTWNGFCHWRSEI